MKFGPYQQPAKVQVPPIHRPPVAEHDDNLDLEAIRARAEAATPGPWMQWREWTVTDDRNSDLAEVVSDKPDAEFIAHARTDIPALLAALGAERAKNTEALAALDEPMDGSGFFRNAAGLAAHDAAKIKKARRILGGKD